MIKSLKIFFYDVELAFFLSVKLTLQAFNSQLKKPIFENFVVIEMLKTSTPSLSRTISITTLIATTAELISLNSS